MLVPLLVLLCFVLEGDTLMQRYDGYQVFSITPKDESALQALIHLQTTENQVDFWKETSVIGRPADVLVHQAYLPILRRKLAKVNVEVHLAINNVQSLIDAEQERLNTRQVFKPAHDPNTFTFNQYHKHSEINYWLDNIAAANPTIASTFSLGKSFEGRDMKAIKIGAPNRNKQGFWLDAGIHAREWIAPATAVYIINQLISQYSTEPTIKYLVDNLDFYIIPVLNPDGYDYSFTNNRLWRKTRSGPYQGFEGTVSKTCWGVDPNRNFPVVWNGVGASSNPCNNTYSGPSALSEVECNNTANWYHQNQKALNVQAYVTFHSYGQFWMYPFAYKSQTYPSNKNELEFVAWQATNALKAVHGKSYRVGSPSDILYPASGSSMDFVDNQGNASDPETATPSLRWNYALELRPVSRTVGFILDQSQIIPTGEETFAGLQVVMYNMIASRKN